ncbi:MAG TPA: helix-turn-helix domain-containing protein [Allosphingosinicella sp.]|nr:helix-turn-helix domain-containing protein [Allosphingosinicella sp.]
MNAWFGHGRETAVLPVLDVTVVLMEDGLSSTAIMPAEIFHCAGALWDDIHCRPPRPRFRVRTVTLGGDPVRSPYGIDMAPFGAIDEVKQTDIVIIPTSGMELDVKLVEHSALLPWLRRHYAQGAYVVGVCMGTAYLAEAGLLDGKVATTHWAMCDEFRERWPNVCWHPEMFVTEDTRLLCSGGVCGSIDVSLYLVEKLCGHEVAMQCAKALLLPMPRILQSGYSMLPVSKEHADERIRSIETWLQQNFREAVPARELAERAGLTERTFARRFKAATGRMPAAYVQALRIEAAKALLEQGDMPIQTISVQIGYEDVGFFRSLFKRSTGMTPVEYRTHFAPLNVRAKIAYEMA